MASLKSLTLLALLFSLSLAVIADTSNDATHAKDDEVKPSKATDAIEPQQRGNCWYGCCGVWSAGRCTYCCRRPQDETNEAVEAVEPQQSASRCKNGCCAGSSRGRCIYCC